jgi:hypothetical protein
LEHDQPIRRCWYNLTKITAHSLSWYLALGRPVEEEKKPFGEDRMLGSAPARSYYYSLAS